MNIKQSVAIAAVLSLAYVSFASFATPQEGKRTPEGYKPLPEQKSVAEARAKIWRTCDSEFTFDYAYGTHYAKDQKFRLIGPLPMGGHIILVIPPDGTPPPPPPHDTLPGPYFGLNVSTTTPPTMFLLETVVTNAQHPTQEPHPQSMEIERYKNGCPEKVRFDVLYDVDDDGNDHGGHAGASN